MAIHPAKRRFSLLFLVIGIFILWVALNFTGLRGAWATNNGFLALNRFRAGQEVGIFNAGLNRQSIDLLERATDLNSGGNSAWRALGYLLLEQGDEDAALAAWRNSTGIPAELFDHGARAGKAGDDDQALVWFQRAVAVAPDMVNGWLEIGAIYQQREEYNAAAIAFMTGLEATPNNSDLVYRLGQLHTNMDEPVDWQTVLALAEQAIAQGNFIHDWSLYQSHYLRGEALRNLGRGPEALAEYIKVTEGLPNYYWGMVRRAELTWEVAGDAAASEQYYWAAIDIDPGSKWAYRLFALDLAAMGRLDEARPYFKKVLSLDPSDQVAAGWLERNP